MSAAEKVLKPDHRTADELGEMNARINCAGTKVNQLARRMNEAKLRKAPFCYSAESHVHLRELAHVITEITEPIHEMFRVRLANLDMEVTKALAQLLPAAAEHNRPLDDKR
ncbi:MAG: hypothetical protein II336_12185 [Loktanella sp.]|nr:hypothetical protein [Loktanella sp.]